MPCGITFAGLSSVEVNPSVLVAIVLPARQFFVHRCMLLFMLASLIFVKRPRLQTRIFPDHQRRRSCLCSFRIQFEFIFCVSLISWSFLV